MWTCSKCGEKIDDQFDSCWKCSTPRNIPASDATKPGVESPKWRVAHKTFRGTWATWEGLFEEAQDFANEIGYERVINIAHSADRADGVVAVWYLENDDQIP